MKRSPVIYMQNLLNCYEEKKINDTKVILNPVNGDLCANGTLSSSYSFKKKTYTLFYSNESFLCM